jgi:SAM-dependent methyltransferase
MHDRHAHESGLPAWTQVGIDFSFEMCVLARARGMLAYQADALALPFADEQFDLVYGAVRLEHIDDLGTLFAELGRVCRPNGRVVVGTANRASLARRCLVTASVGLSVMRILVVVEGAVQRYAIGLSQLGAIVLFVILCMSTEVRVYGLAEAYTVIVWGFLITATPICFILGVGVSGVIRIARAMTA